MERGDRAAAYDVWVSPLSGGGYVKANAAPVVARTFTISWPRERQALVHRRSRPRHRGERQ